MEIIDQKHSSGRKVLIIAAIVIGFIVFFIAGYFLRALASNEQIALPCKPASKEAVKEGGFEAGWQAARDALDNSGIMDQLQARDQLNGEIKEIKEASFIISTRLLNPLDDKSLVEREILVNKETNIVLRQEIADEAITEERAKYDNNVAALRAKVAATEPGQRYLQLFDKQLNVGGLSEAEMEESNKIRQDFELSALINELEEYTYLAPVELGKQEKAGTFKDLRAGMQVTVRADNDIRRVKQFSAVEVYAE